MFLPPAEVLSFVPDYRTTQTPWQGLAPVAAWLIRDLGPARVVELGSYRGDSFFAFQETAQDDPRVRELVAIDSWEGDQHTGAYGGGVHDQFMAELQRRADPRARAIRSRFDAALAQFEDGSIDLLHIDGAHDYASVRADFDGWLPRMAPDGVILFHDTVVRTDDFGVWQLWDELVAAYPGRTFNIEHSNGLGILCLGDSREGQIRSLGALGAVEAAIVRNALRIAGDEVTGLTAYELALIQRSGGAVAEDHVFARGGAREAVETLRRIETLNGAASDRVIDARIERLVTEQAGDVFAAVRPMIAQDLSSLRGAMEDRIERTGKSAAADAVTRLVTEQAGEVVAALEPALDRLHADRLDRRIERLVTEQAGDVFAAVRPALDAELASARAAMEDYVQRTAQATARDLIDARIERLFAEQAADVFSALSPQIGRFGDELQGRLRDELRDAARIKNDAQDDAIIGIGAKVDAHEAAIQELANYLRQVFSHPLFRG